MTESPGTSPLSETDANEADVQEQFTDVTEVDGPEAPPTSLEVDEFDAAEQGLTVGLDPEEYR